jgi:uncharacterized YigZ family protein
MKPRLMTNDYYNTIDTPSSAQYKDRGSKFIAYAFPVLTINDFKEKLAGVKKEHPKAAHHCFAYRLGLDGTVFRVSDDGEPSGSAGRPILGQIDSKQVTNVAVVVVRYFGGTLLGVPGLINAYKTATSLALQLTPIIAKPILIHYLLRFDYTQMNEVLRLLRQFECTVGNMQNQLFSSLEAGIPRNRLDDVMYKLRDLRGIEIVEK